MKFEHQAIDFSKWDDTPITSRPWLVGQMVPADDLTLLIGQCGQGKTMAALQMAFCVSLGLPWLGLPTTQTDVVFVCRAGEEREVVRRVAWMAGALGMSHRRMTIVGAHCLMEHGVPTGEWEHLKSGAPFVVIDDWRDLVVYDQNIPYQPHRFGNELRRLGCASMIVETEDEWLFGRNMARSVLRLVDHGQGYREFVHLRAASAPRQNAVVGRIVDGSYLSI